MTKFNLKLMPDRLFMPLEWNSGHIVFIMSLLSLCLSVYL